MYTNHLIIKGHLESLFRINTAPVPAVLSNDILADMELGFISKKYKLWVKNTVILLPAKIGYINVFFSRNRHLHLREPV
jgi:hypothetical protein